MRLNGWQRIGVILSCIWLPIGFFWGGGSWVEAEGAPVSRALTSCIVNSDSSRAAENACQAIFDRDWPVAIAGHWWAGIAFALIPAIVCWLLAWMTVRLFRWVRAGF